MSWLKNVVHGVFHWSNITHIANAYPEDIWVGFNNTKLEADRVKLEAAVGVAGKSGNIEMELKKVASASWVKVASGGTPHRKDRNAKTEYVTVVAVKRLDQATAAKNQISGEVLVLDYEVGQNFSFIVTGQGEFLKQKYGDGNLFLDYLGVDHTP